MTRKYIFILCPPFQGSTMIVNLLNSSLNVSTFLDVRVWAGECQYLYKKHGDKDYEKNRWDPDYNLDMDMVNKIFNLYLDKDKQIWVEKNPPTICRAKMYQDYFSKLGDVYFIISIRSPYSTDHYDSEEWIKYAKYQKYNLENLKNVIYINYEDCCLNLDNVILKITNNIPELGKINNNNKSNLKGAMRNNERGKLIHSNKVDRVIDKEQKNKILINNIELLEFFGYSIIK